MFVLIKVIGGIVRAGVLLLLDRVGRHAPRAQLVDLVPLTVRGAAAAPG